MESNYATESAENSHSSEGVSIPTHVGNDIAHNHSKV